jgi:Mg/Co/Ni transporter MgtE
LLPDVRELIHEANLSPLAEARRVADIMANRFVHLPAELDRRDVVKIFRKYDRSPLPVVDAGNRVTGSHIDRAALVPCQG